MRISPERERERGHFGESSLEAKDGEKLDKLFANDVGVTTLEEPREPFEDRLEKMGSFEERRLESEEPECFKGTFNKFFYQETGREVNSLYTVCKCVTTERGTVTTCNLQVYIIQDWWDHEWQVQ